MNKRILSILLTSLLLCSAVAPGIAAEGGDSADRLAAVTGKVKNTLGLDTQRYQDFSGQLTEGGLAPTWRLSWSGEDGSLEITASESGKILSYSRYSEDEDRGSAPLSLPKTDPDKAKAAAKAFLDRVLGSAETVDLDASASEPNYLRETRNYFRGTILLHGLPSPLNFSLTVRTSDYAVIQFRRDTLETGYMGTLPAASFRMRQSAAEPLLRGTLSLRLEYVLEEGEKTAVLRYLPNRTDSFYVDDASQKLVNLTRLYEELGEGGSSGSSRDEAAPDPSVSAGADSNGGLTQAEQLGADKLKGTLPKETLDQRARSIEQLGLNSYTLASVSYWEEELEKDAPIITARLSYAKREGEETRRRVVTLNAKTGALIEVSSSRPWDREDCRVSEDTARKTAEAFLAARQGEWFSQCEAYSGDPGYTKEDGRYGTWNFQYARKVNGYFFPDNQFSIGIDTADGSVSSYSQTWSADVQFADADGIVSMEQAVQAYFKTFQVSKGYVAVPQKLDLSDPEYAPLAEMDYRVFNSLKLGWQLTAPERSVRGIDAKTGKPVFWTGAERGALEYSDLAGSQAKRAAETLAKYGIGYGGGKLEPGKKLTQLDLVVLLASTQGSVTEPENLADDADRLYRIAYSMGMLRREERNDSQLLSRMDLIKYLLDAGGYGPAARLQGIYRTDFSDEAEIPAQILGYAALAQAMGVVQGDKLNPGQSVTRGDAVILLCAFMERS